MKDICPKSLHSHQKPLSGKHEKITTLTKHFPFSMKYKTAQMKVSLIRYRSSVMYRNPVKSILFTW